MPLVLSLAVLMALIVSSAALAAPSEKGEENGKGRDKKEASEQEASDDNSSDRQASQQEGSGSSTPPDDDGDPCEDSHGSDTGQGANTDGPDNEYTSTCDGRPSDNGNDSGGGGGRPCAGCVGNADDKNPPGQARNGDDANNGYECDGNNGVGGKKSSPANGNPAHTGCRQPPVDVCTVNCGPPPSCPPGSTAAECLPPTCPNGSAMPANGKCNKPPKLCPDGTPMPPDGTCVRGIIIDRDKKPGLPDIVRNIRVEGAPEPQPQVAPGAVLPFTGGDLVPLVTLALVLMAIGALSLRRPAPAGGAEPSGDRRQDAAGATVQLPSGKSFTLPLRRVL